jgi:hypothetical protein
VVGQRVRTSAPEHSQPTSWAQPSLPCVVLDESQLWTTVPSPRMHLRRPPLLMRRAAHRGQRAVGGPVGED